MNEEIKAQATNGASNQVTREQVIEAIQTCYDPEIPVNIHEMGLIYGITISPSGGVEIRMTLTSPNCPSAASLPLEVEAKVNNLPGVTAVKVYVVWDPIWNPSMMSEAARLQLDMFW
jgi:FeS assembly SUF system protein